MLNAQSFNHSIEINGGVGLSKYTKYSIGAGYQSGIQIEKFYVGAGIGFRYADALYYSSTLIEDYFESRDGKYLIPLT